MICFQFLFKMRFCEIITITHVQSNYDNEDDKLLLLNINIILVVLPLSFPTNYPNY